MLLCIRGNGGGWIFKTELLEVEDIRILFEMLTSFMDLYQTPEHKSAPASRPNFNYSAPSWETPGGNRMKFILIALRSELSGLELVL